ncbi:hypothetical protein glysoja_000072 [Glycine soja]|nr:hypothetical protein glysoja_000072 [Glycine soja]
MTSIKSLRWPMRKKSGLSDVVYPTTSGNLKGLPQGIVHANSDLELKPSWSTSSSRSKAVFSNRNLLAVPVGIKQKHNVDVMVQKKTLQLFYSIMTARLMDGGILTGVAMSYKLLLGIKQSGESMNDANAVQGVQIQVRNRHALGSWKVWLRFSLDQPGTVLGILYRMTLSMDGDWI